MEIQTTIDEINNIILRVSKDHPILNPEAIGIDDVISRMSMSKTLYNAARCLDETVYYKKYLLDNLNLYFSNKRLELNEVLTGFSIPTAIGVIDEKTGKRVSIEPTNPYEAMKVAGWL
jgi:hypothetical protein